MAVKMTIGAGHVTVTSPYHPDWAPLARSAGGTWNGARREWSFDPRDEQRVRDALRAVYGTDGSPEDNADVVTVRLRLADHQPGRGQGGVAYFGGRQIARRPARDSDVRLGEGVVLIEGRLPGRGGSMQYPAIEAGEDVLLEVRDLPRRVLADEDDYTIVGETVDLGALRAERETVVARLAEIDRLLAEQ